MTERREKFEKTTPCRWEIPRSTTCGHRVTPMNLSSGAGAGASRASSSPGWRWLRSHVGSMLAAAPARSRRRSWQQPPREVLGVDPSEGFIAHTRRHTQDSRAKFQVGDAQALPVANSDFDVAVAGLG